MVLELLVDEYDGWLDADPDAPAARRPTPLDLPTAPRRIKRPSCRARRRLTRLTEHDDTPTSGSCSCTPTPTTRRIGQGATMAATSPRALGVTLVTCTGGEMGEILVPELEHLAADKDDTLGEHQRKVELDNAMKALGVTDHRYLGGFGATATPA